ncbi:hypothetical protein ACFV4K_07320 [Nocardia sp. NPDC059764]|uniref:hypothetical protein n=1 Tax=Nocardia sp. NPDC059764 TaxID=3346939 RepID=UPI00365044D6
MLLPLMFVTGSLGRLFGLAGPFSLTLGLGFRRRHVRTGECANHVVGRVRHRPPEFLLPGLELAFTPFATLWTFPLALGGQSFSLPFLGTFYGLVQSSLLPNPGESFPLALLAEQFGDVVKFTLVPFREAIFERRVVRRAYSVLGSRARH